MRLGATKTGASTTYNGLGDQLYDKGGARPTLDLNFASNGSLVDSVTGKTLVTHTRASDATYVDGDGIIKDAVTNIIWPSEDFNSSPWVKAGVSVTADAVDNPYGEQTADTLTTTGTSFARVVQNKTINSNTFVVSTYAKAGTAPHLAGTVELNPGFTQVLRLHANLSTGVTQQFASAGTISATSGSEQLANGWWRFYWIITTPTTGSYDIFWAVSDQETGFGVAVGKTLHLWGTQLEESSTLGEYVKTTSTINSAPRFDHKVTRTTTNLIPYSEDLDNSAWTHLESTVTANAAIAPDGTLSADKMVPNTVNATHNVNDSISAGLEYLTFSVYLKSELLTTASIRAGKSGNYVNADVNLATGTIDSPTTAGTATNASSAITDVGNGWYRCSVTADNLGDGVSVNAVIYTPGDETQVGNDLYGIYIWGAQLEQNSDVGPYVKTTGAAATKVDAEPLGLLVEESRTNDVYESENIGNVSPWQRVNVTRIAGFDAPDGTTNAVRLLETTVNNGHFVYWNSSSFLTTATASAFVKPIGREYIGIRAYKASNVWENVVFNVTGEGSVVNYQSGSSSSYSNVQGFIEKHADGWYRISITCTNAAGVNLPLILHTHTTATPTLDTSGEEDFVGDTSKGFYAWGAQIESGSFPTSYIRNTTGSSTVTRSADVTSIEGNDFGTFNLLQYSEEFEQSYWTKQTNTTVTPNQAVAPDGTFTADLAEGNGTDGLFSGITPVSTSSDNTKSVWIRSVTGSATVQLKDAQQTVGTTTCSLTTSWQRFTLTETQSGGNARIWVTNIPAGGVYIWGAQLEESSTATPYVKSDVTWTSRASNATYYDYTGTLRKSSYNLLTYSEDFTNAIWPASGRATLLTATGVDNPFGGTNASTWKNGGTAADELIHRVVTVTAGIPHTYSVWLRRRSGTGTINMYVGDNSPIEVTSQVTTEWKRISVTATPSTTTGRAYVAILGSGDEVDVWGAQLEAGPYAGDYAKTEAAAASTARDVAFLPDGSGNFVSAGELLLEDAGTNLITSSEDFSSAWDIRNTTITINQITAPDNTTTADKFIPDTSANRHWIQRNLGTTLTTYTGSVFAKAGELSTITLRIGRSLSYQDGAKFDLSTGTISNQGTAIDSASIESVGNGWYRCVVTNTCTATGSQYFALSHDDGDLTAGDGTSGIYIWGAQTEENSYATSYIPTYGSTATRAADVSSSSSNTFGNSFYNQSEGTVFGRINLDTDRSYSGTFRHITHITPTGSNNSSIGILITGSNQYQLQVKDNSATVAGLATGSNTGGFSAVAGVYKVNDFAVSANGGAAAVDTSGAAFTTESPQQMTIGTVRDGNSLGTFNGNISRLTYWPTRLNNDTLKTITV